MTTDDPYAIIARTIDRAHHARQLSLYVALGDSFTAGTGCPPGEAWPERLANGLRARNVGPPSATSRSRGRPARRCWSSCRRRSSSSPTW